MPNQTTGLTPEMVERIAKVVVKEMSGSFRSTIADDVGKEVSKQLQSYFGDMTAAQHSIQHSNLDKLLNRLDYISSGFVGGIVSKVTSFLITALLLGLAAYGVKNGLGN